VLLLVIVVIVLMTIMGATLLQVTRSQRLAEAVLEGDMDDAINAVNNRIIQVLKDDLVNDGGEFFDPDPLNPGGADEPYDYPWTNETAQRDAFPLLQATPGPYPAAGGEHDDTWLADLEPYDWSTTPKWRKVTDLTAVYLGWDNTANSGVGGFIGVSNPGDVPREDIIDFALDGSIQADRRDTNTEYELTSPLLVDADGDGINDSRLEWVPMGQVNGYIYTMAVRIVDLAGMVNANTATSLRDDSQNLDTSPDGAHAPRWNHPTEIDFGGFYMQTLAGVDPIAIDNLATFMDYRWDPSATPTSIWAVPGAPNPPLVGYGSRNMLWMYTGRYYPNATPNDGKVFSTLDELELRHRNGLNRATEDPAKVTIDGHGMGSFFREDVTTEADYSVAQLSRYAGGTNSPTEEEYFTLEPRHQTTVASATAIYAPWPLASNRLKVDLNEAPLDVVRDRIAAVAKLDVGSGAMPLPVWATGTPDEAATDYANQFAVDWLDYRDADTTPTEWSETGLPTRYGLEALPFISEVYAQAKYDVTTASTGADLEGDGSGPPNDYDLEWTRIGNAGYAIEIRNPFNVKVGLSGVTLWIDAGGTPVQLGDTDRNGDGEIDLGDIAALPADSQGRVWLEPGQVLVIYVNSNNGSDAANDAIAGDPTNDLITRENGGPIEVTVAQDWPNDSGQDGSFSLDTDGDGGFSGMDIQVQLRVVSWNYTTASAGATLIYSEADTQSAPDSYQQRVYDRASSPASASDYWQRAAIGNGNGVNTMLIAPGEFVGPSVVPDDTAATVGRDANVERLGEADKTTSGAANKVDPTKNQILLYNNLAAVHHVAELAQLAVLPYTGSGTIGDAWNAVGPGPTGPSSVTDLMLNLDPDPATNPFIDNTGNFAVPYAVLLLEQFTTLSPLSDGVDNDGDGSTDNDGEYAVPGLVNINTMPAHLMEKILPIADDTLRNYVVDQILMKRDAPGRTVGTTSAQGLAMISEMYDDLSQLLTTGATYSGDTEATAAGTRVDFQNYPTPGSYVPDDVADDREEAALPLRWLQQLCTTRSDVFAAYVMIKEYDGSDFSAGETNSVRYIAIFHRGLSDEGSVKMIAFERLE
jgi:hypothetical protein